MTTRVGSKATPSKRLQSTQGILAAISRGTAVAQSNIQYAHATGGTITVSIIPHSRREFELSIERQYGDGEPPERKTEIVKGTRWDAMIRAEEICGSRFGSAEWWG